MAYLGLGMLIVAYMMSQFFRAMLAVMAPALQEGLGAGPTELAMASGVWFLVFAAMQIPVGAALDRIGPRWTSAALFAIGCVGGGAIFALATAPWHLTLAMALIGIGCAPILMASYFIFAQSYPAAAFATLGAMVLGLGSIGNLLASLPMGWAVGNFGWRATMWGLTGLSLLVALAIAALVRNPARALDETQPRGSVLDLLRMRALWPIFAIMLVNYMPAGALRGLWAGPYAQDIFGADAVQIGRVTLLMGLAMVAGNFLYGPLDRLFGTRKWVIVAGNGLCAAACAALWLWADHGLWTSATLLAIIGASGASFAVIIAHGRAFFPAHLTGRGVTLLNLFGVGGVGLGQVLTGRIFDGIGGDLAGYRGIFAFMALAITTGVLIYITSRDRTD